MTQDGRSNHFHYSILIPSQIGFIAKLCVLPPPPAPVPRLFSSLPDSSDKDSEPLLAGEGVFRKGWLGAKMRQKQELRKDLFSIFDISLIERGKAVLIAVGLYHRYHKGFLVFWDDYCCFLVKMWCCCLGGKQVEWAGTLWEKSIRGARLY